MCDEKPTIVLLVTSQIFALGTLALVIAAIAANVSVIGALAAPGIMITAGGTALATAGALITLSFVSESYFSCMGLNVVEEPGYTPPCNLGKDIYSYAVLAQLGTTSTIAALCFGLAGIVWIPFAPLAALVALKALIIALFAEIMALLGLYVNVSSCAKAERNKTY